MASEIRRYLEEKVAFGHGFALLPPRHRTNGYRIESGDLIREVIA